MEYSSWHTGHVRRDFETLPKFSYAAQVVILHVGFLRSFNWYVEVFVNNQKENLTR
jgi:hypothetical protein